MCIRDSSKPNAVLATIFGITLAISGFFPPNEKVFHFTMMLIVAMFALWSRQSAIIGVVLAVISLVIGFIPLPDGNVAKMLIPDAMTAYITIGIAVVGLIITYMSGGEANRFEGVPEGDKIKQRQKLIADIEKRYGEAD